MAGRSPIKSSETIQQAKWLTPMPIGPLVAGVLLSLIILIGAAWCYRNYVGIIDGPLKGGVSGPTVDDLQL